MRVDNPLIWGETALQAVELESQDLVEMAYQPIPDPEHDLPGPVSSARERQRRAEGMRGEDPSLESDIAELAAKFAAHWGGNLSPESSADLALEVVLNEIVQQACLATGANGAAVVLERDGEMECRASTGSNAPELGVRLGSESGLTAECIRTRSAQRCADAQADPRANAEASRQLGVRSVMILPLLRSGGDLAGVLEVFSARPGAFGDRDELTMQALAQRILKNLERAGEAIAIAQENRLAAPVAAISEREISGTGMEDSPGGSTNLVGDFVDPEPPPSSARGGVDVLTVVLGVAVVCVAILLGTLVGIRLGWHRSASNRGKVSKVASGSTAAASRAEEATTAQPGGVASDAKDGTAAVPMSTAWGVGNSAAGGKSASAAQVPAVRSSESVPPAGSLLVYENGREVFRMPPTAEQSENASNKNTDSTSNSRGVQRASSVEKVDRMQVSSEAAEGSVLHRVEPDYPEEARQQQIQGAVVLGVRAGRDGSIQEVKLLSGQPLLADAAMAAVKQWRFKPLVVKGQTVEMQTTITLTFRLPR
jgi:TonB family protein